MNVCIGWRDEQCPEITSHRRCPRHARMAEADRGPREQYGPEHRAMSKAVLELWIAEHGPWCPGYGERHAPHASDDLVADHVDPGNPKAGYLVKCRSANTMRMQDMRRAARA